MRKLLWLFGCSLTLWVLAALPAWWLAPERALLETGVALLLCLVPMSATLLWFAWAHDTTPEGRLLVVVGGTGIRMFFVIVMGVLLHQSIDALQHNSFLLWVVFFYLATLAVEVVLMVGTGKNAAPAPTSTSADARNL